MNASQIESLLISLAPYLVPILVTLLAPLVAKALSRLPANRRNQISDIVSTAVRAVEQSCRDCTGEQKKARAIEFIEVQLTHVGLSIPMTVLEPMIEASVFGINLVQADMTPSLPVMGTTAMGTTRQ